MCIRDRHRGEQLVAFRIAGVEPMVRPLQLIRSVDRGLTPAAAAFVTFVARNAGLAAPAG